MHKVFYSNTLNTFAQVNAQSGWAEVFTADGRDYGRYADIYLRGSEFAFVGNERLGREAVEAAPDIMREAFLPFIDNELTQAKSEVAEAEARVNRINAHREHLLSLGVDNSSNS